jgi:hypothetical protein
MRSAHSSALAKLVRPAMIAQHKKVFITKLEIRGQ